jgi:hypothetical protein
VISTTFPLVTVTYRTGNGVEEGRDDIVSRISKLGTTDTEVARSQSCFSIPGAKISTTYEMRALIDPIARLDVGMKTSCPSRHQHRLGILKLDYTTS